MATDSSTDDAKTLRELRALLQTGLVQHLSLLHTLKSGVSGADLTKVAQRLATEAPSVLTDLARTTLRAQTEVFQVGTKHFDRIADSLFGGKRPATKIALRLEGRPGKTVHALFKVRNPNAAEAKVRLTQPSLCSASEEKLASRVTFHRVDAPAGADACADGMKLPGEGTASIEVRINLDPATAPGRYRGDFVVLADEVVAGLVDIEAVVAAPEVVDFLDVDLESGKSVAQSAPVALRNFQKRPVLAAIGSPVEFRHDSDGNVVDIGLSLDPSDAGLDRARIPPGETLQVVVVLSCEPRPAAGAYTGEVCLLLDSHPAKHIQVRLQVKQ